MLPTNLAFLRIAKRAERQDDEVLQKTFVNFGSVFEVLSSVDHQIIFGRRGTGKTHLLTVLRQRKSSEGVIATQLDMRNIGSAGGIYGDPTIPLAQRATRLLVDVLAAIHSTLLELAVENDGLINLGITGRALDEFFSAHTAVKVVGSVTQEASTSAENSASLNSAFGVATTVTGATLKADWNNADSARESQSARIVRTGHETLRVNFGNVASALRKIVDTLPNKQLWILLDEWSEVPLDLQPFLADLLRRAVLPIRGVAVKIAAIEQRSRFLIPDPDVGNVGLELGADVSTAITLDDYMVFDNDESKAITFFKTLVLKHVRAALELESVHIPASETELISQGFTQSSAFDEVVRACEGVPRDAIHILSHAAQRANDQLISIGDVRAAAQQWYLASKETAVGSNENARAPLVWIVERVIKERQAKAFLLESGTRDALIDFLYDERVLHVLRKGMSAKDSPGKRFQVYGIDYGCYVDLVNTARAPRGMLNLGEDTADFVAEVPKTDLRSVRRCILDLPAFYVSL